MNLASGECTDADSPACRLHCPRVNSFSDSAILHIGFGQCARQDDGSGRLSTSMHTALSLCVSLLLFLKHCHMLAETVGWICRKTGGSGSVRSSHQTVSGASKNQFILNKSFILDDVILAELANNSLA